MHTAIESPWDELPDGRRYLRSLPKIIPADRVLVHNSVRASRRQGQRGARYWLQPAAANLEPCACGWAAEHSVHYHVKKET